MRCAAEGTSGHDVCLTREWLGEPTTPWRALIVRRRVFDELARRLRPATFGAEPVAVGGAVPVRGEPGRRDRRPRRVRELPDVRAVLATVARDRERYGHVLGAGASEREVRRAFAREGAAPADEVVQLFTASRCLELYAWHPGAPRASRGLQTVDVAHTRGRGPRAINRFARELAPLPAGSVCFAVSAKNTFWCVDARGVVTGLGIDGDTYGPAAPLRQWLRDQVVDLRYITDDQATLGAWTDQVPVQWFS